MKLNGYKREISALIAYLGLLTVVGLVAPAFYGSANLSNVLINNAPALLIATGMTLVILAGEIDISVGSQFAVASVVAGMLAKPGIPWPGLVLGLILIGGLMGAVNGVLIGLLRLP